MRIVQIAQLDEGDIIAKDIISFDGGILLKKNTRFREVFRKKLVERNITDVYIDDELSKGIEPQQIISEQLRETVTSDIKKEFQKLEHNVMLDIDVIKNVSEMLLCEMQGKELIWEMQDLKVNDFYTYEHCISVAILAGLVCKKMNLAIKQQQEIVVGALIHDIGKIIIPKDVLNKPGRLTKEEYELIKTHAEIGYKMIKDNEQLSAVSKLIVLCHHEREDGSGYPLGKGEELHIGSKIVAACDLYHALISDRCYRQGLPLNEVVSIAQKEKINAEVRKIIECCLAFYPVGALVLLNNEKIAIVEKNYSSNISHPLVNVIYDLRTHSKENYKLNLKESKIDVKKRILKLPWEK